MGGQNDTYPGNVGQSVLQRLFIECILLGRILHLDDIKELERRDYTVRPGTKQRRRCLFVLSSAARLIEIREETVGLALT